MAIIRNLVVKIGADISSLSKGLRTAQSRLTKFSRSLTSIGTSLTMKVTMPLVLLAKQSMVEQKRRESHSIIDSCVSNLRKYRYVSCKCFHKALNKTYPI